jgi:flagella basal body P-ring formation protein FlgA
MRDTLHDAGVNLAVVRFAGATSCTVARTDVKFDERSALDQWIAAKDQLNSKPGLLESPTTQPVKASVMPTAAVTKAAPTEAAVPAAAISAPAARQAVAEAKAYRSLRDYLVAEVAERLNMPADQLQFHFNPVDEKVLNLAEPHFEFNVNPPRNRNLGEVTWDVTIVANGTSQKTSLTANVKAWQSQLVVDKPLGYRQIIRDDDLVDRRTLVDRIGEDPLVTREQVVGQMAGRELRLGTVLTAKLIDPIILVKSGQLVSITLTQGTIRAKSVARATEQGTIGQTIRVKNEVTNNTFDVVVTGPQTARLPASGPSDRRGVAVLDR